MDSEPTRDDERALIAAARAGDREAWSQLCRLHAPRLAAYLGARLRRPAVVESVVADAIVAAWSKLAEMDGSEGFAPWLRRIGANLAMRWRAEHPAERTKEPFPEERCDGDATALARMRRLEDALGRLPDAMRMALEQRFRAGLDGESLEEVLHLEPGASMDVVRRALESLHRELAE